MSPAMSVRIAAPLFLLASCALYTGAPEQGDDAPGELPCPSSQPGCSWDECFEGDCYDDYVYECDPATGEWVVASGVCEARAGYVYGDLHLEQWFESAALTCPPPRSPIAMFAAGDGTVTGGAPIEVVASQIDGGGYGDSATLRAIVADNWSGIPVSITYDLEVSPYDSVFGYGAVNVPDCQATLYVTGVQCPSDAEPCVVYDDGWNFWCYQGEVFEDDLTRVGYCLPGEEEEVCQTGGEPHVARVAACANGCAGSGVTWFETVEERDAFDPASLCAP